MEEGGDKGKGGGALQPQVRADIPAWRLIPWCPWPRSRQQRGDAAQRTSRRPPWHCMGVWVGVGGETRVRGGRVRPEVEGERGGGGMQPGDRCCYSTLLLHHRERRR